MLWSTNKQIAQALHPLTDALIKQAELRLQSFDLEPLHTAISTIDKTVDDDVLRQVAIRLGLDPDLLTQTLDQVLETALDLTDGVVEE